jgi:beta-phosphoglucomutase-like phosphatase (HAD superfamily)
VILAILFDMDGVLTDSEPLINAAAVAMFRARSWLLKGFEFSNLAG